MSLYDRNESLPQRRPTPIERDALEWVARVDLGLTSEQQADLERWLAADVRHATVFREFDATWALLARVREMPEAGDAASGGNVDSQPSAACSMNGAADATSPWAQGGRSAARRWAIPASLAAAAVFVVAYFRSPLAEIVGARNTPYAASVATDLGEVRKVALPDGSVAQLNTDSAVEVQFSSSERRLRLIRGEAHFTVANNRARPFTVSAGGVDVRAVGTEFNVRLRSGAVEVLVTEGKVTVGDEPGEIPQPTVAGPDPVRDTSSRDSSVDKRRLPQPSVPHRALGAGEKITITRSSAVSVPAAAVVVPPVEIEHTLAWRDRRLEFASAPLAEMVAEFNRYNRRKLVIADGALATQRFGGAFRPDDPAGFVRALELNFGVVTEQRPDETILRLAAP